MSTTVVTGPVRLSYVHVFEPWANEVGQEQKYSCQLVIPKSDKATLAKIRAGFAEAAELGKAKFNGTVPSNLKTTLHDGDTEGDLDKNPHLAGCMYMSVSSKQRPGIVDKAVQPILDPNEVYSGCWARVEINAYAYNTSGNKGVSYGLNHIQKIRDDDPLDGRTRAEDAFDPIVDDAESLI
jgi:hypothetical protein